MGISELIDKLIEVEQDCREESRSVEDSTPAMLRFMGANREISTIALREGMIIIGAVGEEAYDSL